MIEQASLVIGEGNWAVKSDSLLGYKINNGKYYPREMSVVRATTGTRINEDGLVEVVPYNLLQYSQQFQNAIWTPRNGTFTDNFATAPDGTLTASRWVATDTDPYVYQGFTGNGGNYVASVYVKGVGSSIGKTASIRVSGTLSNFTITGEWQRVQISTTISTSVIIGCEVPDPAVIGDTIYIWGFQLVEGSSALDYLPTTDRLDVARIDYSSGSAALLVEPQRTNLLTYSSSFDNGAWVKNNATITANDTTAPDGTMTADKVVVSANTDNVIQTGLPFVGVGNSNTISLYIKGSGSNIGKEVGLYIDREGGGTYEASTVVGVLTAEWQRIEVTHTWVNSQSSVRYKISQAITTTPASEFFIWGAQLEAGSYPTSYIPTTSASVTRNADAISKTGISSLIGQTEGAVMIDINIDSSFAKTDMRFIDVSDDSIANWYFIGTNNANEIRFYFRSSNTAYVSITTTLTNGRHKLAFAYANNDYVAYVDGVQVHSTTTLAVGSTSKVTLGNDFGGFNPSKQFINASALWKTRLTNTQLAQLTTI